MDGWTRLLVVEPPTRAPAGETTDARFRDAVRRLAATYSFPEHRRPVRVDFDPTEDSVRTRNETRGEPIDRV